MAKKTSKAASPLPCDFNGAYQIIERIKEPSDKLTVLEAIIKAHKEAGDLKAAEKVVAEALRMIHQWVTKSSTEYYSKGYHANLIFREFSNLCDKKLAVEIIKEAEAAADNVKDPTVRCDDYLKSAERAYSLGDKKYAEELNAKTEKDILNFRYDSQKPEVFFRLARLWTEMSNTKKAKNAIQSVEDLIGKLKKPEEVLFSLGLYYIHQGQDRRGLDLLKTIRGTRGIYPEVVFQAEFPRLIKAGFKDDIHSILESLKDKKSADKQIVRNFSLANAYLEAGDTRTAQSIADTIQNENDITQEDFPFYLLFGFYLKQNKFVEAEQLLDDAKRPIHHYISFLFDLAAHQFERGKKTETKRLIERAAKTIEKIKDADDRNELLLCVAACWARFGDKDAARRIYEKISTAPSGSKNANIMKTIEALRQNVEIGYYQWFFGFADDAKKTTQYALKQASTIKKSKAGHYAGVVDMFLRLGDTKTAKALYDEIIDWVETEGNAKSGLDNNLMNFGKGLVCQYNDYQSDEPMKMLKIQED